MSWFKGFELLDPPSSSLFYRESAICCRRPPSMYADEYADERLGFALDILNPIPLSPFDLLLNPPPISPLGLLDATTVDDLFISSSAAAFRRHQERAETELYLHSLSGRVAALELGFDRALRSKPDTRLDRKYKWTAEIKGAKADGIDRKYKLTAEAKAGEARSLKWTTEIKGKGKDAPSSRTYTFQTSSAPAAPTVAAYKEEKKKKSSGPAARTVVIEDETIPGAIAIRKAFEKRAVDRSKAKRKELSLLDATVIIQLSFRAYLVRRSQVLRGLRGLAVAKAKLKDIRALFSNFSYRRRVANDAEEQQRFSEKIIVLLLTVDAIEGPDCVVRAAKKSMVEELEAMLEVVDPESPGTLGSIKKTTGATHRWTSL